MLNKLPFFLPIVLLTRHREKSSSLDTWMLNCNTTLWRKFKILLNPGFFVHRKMQVGFRFNFGEESINTLNASHHVMLRSCSTRKNATQTQRTRRENLWASSQPAMHCTLFSHSFYYGINELNASDRRRWGFSRASALLWAAPLLWMHISHFIFALLKRRSRRRGNRRCALKDVLN